MKKSIVLSLLALSLIVTSCDDKKKGEVKPTRMSPTEAEIDRFFYMDSLAIRDLTLKLIECRELAKDSVAKRKCDSTAWAIYRKAFNNNFQDTNYGPMYWYPK